MKSADTPEMDAATAAGDSATDKIRRALEAAEAANDAAQELADLSAAHRAFAEAVIKGQRRNTLFASGALAGSIVAVVLGGLVYFRSVADLRMAAGVQSEAAALLVKEVKQIDGIGDTVEEQQNVMKTDLLALLEQVKDEIRIAGADALTLPEAEPMGPEIAEAVRAGVKEDIDAAKTELMTALAEIEVKGGSKSLDELKALITELSMRSATAARETASPAPAQATPTPATQAGGARNTRPATRAASAPEPNPFVYP